MSATMDKARALRLQRLKGMLETRLENPPAALEVLLSELVAGERQPSAWEELHAAAVRDGMEASLGAAYGKITGGHRLQQLGPQDQADVLVHAADFHLGVLGDTASAEGLLQRVLEIVPGHREAFSRLERRFESASDARRLVDLYSLVAAAPPKSPSDLASRALNKIVPLPATAPLAEDTCKRLLALVPAHPTLLDVLEAHCRKTKRVELACALIEEAIRDPSLPQALATKHRRQLVELYATESATPANAMPHIEELLTQNPLDDVARTGAEKLLSNRAVAARAAAALQTARRQARPGK